VTSGQGQDSEGTVYEIASPVTIDIKFRHTSAGSPFEEIENPTAGATCIIDSVGQSQTFHGRALPNYAEPIAKGFSSVTNWHYVSDANIDSPGHDYWRVVGDLPGIPFNDGRKYSVSWTEVYINSRTGRFDLILTHQLYTIKGVDTDYNASQTRFVYNTGVHIPACV
jgi:hypothetical protein